MISNIFNSVANTVSDFVDDPIGTATNIAVQPVHDVINVIDGVSEGELRERAILRLGADFVAAMTLEEVVEYLAGEE